MRHLEVIPRHRRPLGLVGRFSIFLGIFIAGSLVVFWFFLADYQKSLPQNLAEQIMNAYRAGDVKTIAQYSGNLPEVLERPELFAKYYEDNTDLDNLYFYLGAAVKPSELCYEFAAGSDPIATLTLGQTGLKSLFGFPKYEIAAITGHPLIGYRITAPGDVMLFVNGRPLSEHYCIDEQNSVSSFVSLTNTVYKTKIYELTDLCYIDELSVLEEEGCDTVVAWSEDGRSAAVEKRISPERQAEVSAFAERFSEAYSLFVTKQDAERAPVLKLLQPDTPFRQALTLYDNKWGISYSAYRYENRVIDRFVQYSATEFSCDIRFDYIVKLDSGAEKIYPYSMTYYLTNRSGQFALVDMQAKA